MSVTAYPTLRLKLTVPQALKIRFLPAIPGTNAGNAAAAAQAAAEQAIAAAAAATAATASKVDKAGDVMTGRLTLSADPTANLHAATKQYVDGSIGGAGSVGTSGPVLTTQLAGFADTSGNFIRGVTLGAGLDLTAGTTLNLDSDLSAIAGLTGVNTIYYRSSDGVWNPVDIGTNLSFAGGILSAAAAGDVASVPTPTNGQFARWTDATHIEGISATTALTAIGAQPLDPDLTALAALSGTNVIYYRSAANTWSPVLIGANMSFTGGTLSSSGGGGGGGVAAVGAPTSGQLARWTTATTIEGIDTSTLGLAPLASPTFTGNPQSVTPATGDNDTSIATTAYVQANLAFFAPLASPVLTGDPQAPTPATSDNDTSIATTAFVKAQAYAPLASPTFTGDPKAPTPTAGDNDTSIATTAFVSAAIAALPAATTTVTSPQGRLTLQTLTPVMTTTQAAKTTIYYTPYVGNKVPIYDGTNMVMTTFAELSVATTDTTKSPAAIGASKVNDWFVWSDAGTVRIGHGPDWTSDTVRGSGAGTTELTRVNGLLVNGWNITNGPAALRGTYIGTTRSNASSQLNWVLATADTAGLYFVWNTYNRIDIKAAVRSSTTSWTYASSTLRQPNAAAFWQVSFVSGLEENGFYTEFIMNGVHSTTGYCAPHIGYDSITTAVSGERTRLNQIPSAVMHGAASFSTTALGAHYVSALEAASGGTCTFYGFLTGGGNTFASALEFEWRY